MSAASHAPKISIIIVNYRVPDEIIRLLKSIEDAELYSESEIIIVDNASNDNSQNIVTDKYNDIIWIQLKNNIGFGKACNAAAIKAKGEYILLLNPDTLISRNTLSDSFYFMENNRDVGLMGPKIINHDGEFQRQCRRSFPTPVNAFFYFSGLSKFFPKNKKFGKYNLSYMDPDESGDVDAISGSFMFIRCKLFKDIGGFDKDFFMFGEDLDLCVKVKDAGFRVTYNPKIQIIHFKGQSCNKNIIKSRLAFYEAMIIFSRKHQHSYGAYFPGWLITLGISLITIMNITGILVKLMVPLLVDLFVINGTLFSVTYLRFQQLPNDGPYTIENIPITTFMHLFISLSYLAANMQQGIYNSTKYSFKRIIVSGLIASILFFTGVYFIKSMGFSRLSFGLSTLLIPIFLAGWRKVLPNTLSWFKKRIFYTGNVIIMGNGAIAKKLIANIETDQSAEITGIIWPDKDDTPAAFCGYPIIGNMENLKSILEDQNANQLLITTSKSWYSNLIEALAFNNLKHLTIKWLPTEIAELDEDKIPEQLTLKDFSI